MQTKFPSLKLQGTFPRDPTQSKVPIRAHTPFLQGAEVLLWLWFQRESVLVSYAVTQMFPDEQVTFDNAIKALE